MHAGGRLEPRRARGGDYVILHACIPYIHSVFIIIMLCAKNMMHRNGSGLLLLVTIAHYVWSVLHSTVILICACLTPRYCAMML
jgi:hypothetical protein